MVMILSGFKFIGWKFGMSAETRDSQSPMCYLIVYKKSCCKPDSI